MRAPCSAIVWPLEERAVSSLAHVQRKARVLVSSNLRIRDKEEGREGGPRETSTPR